MDQQQNQLNKFNQADDILDLGDDQGEGQREEERKLEQ